MELSWPRVKSFFTNNWKIKVGSLLFAGLVHLYVQNSKNTTRVLNIRVEKPEMPQHLLVSSKIPAFTNVHVYGPRELMEFNLSDFRIFMTNPNPSVGKNIYQTHLYPELPEGVEAIYRKEIPVTLDRVMVRELPVVPLFDTENLDVGLAPGYFYTRPRTLKLTGPETILARMDRVETMTMGINGAIRQFSHRVTIARLPEFVSLTQDQPVEIEANMKIIEQSDMANSEGVASRPREGIPERSIAYFADLPVRCSNELRGISLKGDNSAVVSIAVEYDTIKGAPRKENITAQVFCPALYYQPTREVLPGTRISDLPVDIVFRRERDDFDLLYIRPFSVTMNFEKAIVKTPREVRKGLEEHLIR